MDSRQPRYRTGLRHPVLATTGLLLTAVLIFHVYAAFVHRVPPSPQSKSMLERSGGRWQAVRPSVWPPGYPLLLFTARTLRFPIDRVNLLLFYGALALLFVVSKTGLRNLSAVWLPLFYAVCAFNYFNLAQLTSEAMVVPLSLLVLLLLAAHTAYPSWRLLLSLSFCCSVLFLSRYHAILWLLPIVATHLAVVRYKSRAAAAWRYGAFGVVSLAPIALAMLRNYRDTGYLTGMNRLDWASRGLAEREMYASSTGLAENTRLAVKTFVLDFISPVEYATHQANRLLYRLSWLEIGVLVLFVLTACTIGLAVVRYVREVGSVRGALRSWFSASPGTFLAVEFFLAYMAVTLAAWTLGNNDALYSRFLYPSYVYLIITIGGGYALVKMQSRGAALRAPCVLLGVSVALLNVYKLAHGLLGAR